MTTGAALTALAGLGLGVFLVTRDADPVHVVALEDPATNPLMIPPVLDATVVDGVDTYNLDIAPSSHEYLDGVTTSTYSYNGNSVLGPTVRISSGHSVRMSVTNELDEVTTTHWHGGDVPAIADGGPHNPIAAGETWVAEFDVIQPAATLWYHPHLMGATAEHVYAGAAGLLIVDDDNPRTAALPGTYGVDDIPLILQDRDFFDDGGLNFAIDDSGRGNRSSTLTVNGTIDPFVSVPSGFVRLRLLNGSQARIYELGVSGSAMWKIASDGGYLAEPVQIDSLVLAPGDRAEVVVQVGDESVSLVDEAFERVVELRPNGQTSTETSLPAVLTTIEPIRADEVDVERSFHMEQVADGWGINGVQMDMNHVNETVQFGDTEQWTVTVDSGQHVFHVHQTQFQILEINGEPPSPEDAGWEDSVLVNGDRTLVFLTRFNTYASPDVPYMYHCHILDHEDLGMMGQFTIIN